MCAVTLAYQQINEKCIKDIVLQIVTTWCTGTLTKAFFAMVTRRCRYGRFPAVELLVRLDPTLSLPGVDDVPPHGTILSLRTTDVDGAGVTDECLPFTGLQGAPLSPWTDGTVAKEVTYVSEHQRATRVSIKCIRTVFYSLKQWEVRGRFRHGGSQIGKVSGTAGSLNPTRPRARTCWNWSCWRPEIRNFQIGASGRIGRWSHHMKQ